MESIEPNSVSTVLPRGEYSLANAKRYGWSSLSGSLLRERADYLKRLLIGPRVLDAGCGGGGYVDFAASLGFDATGVDKHDFLLALAHERNLRGHFVTGDVCDRLPFADGEFDTTFCLDVLEHVDDVTAIRELARVTRRRLIVAVPQEDQRNERYFLTYSPYLDLTHLRYYTADRLRALVDTVGPKRVEIRPELRVPIETLVQREFRITSRFPGVGWVYRKLFGFLTRRAIGPDWSINLLAVADLQGIDTPPDGSAR